MKNNFYKISNSYNIKLNFNNNELVIINTILNVLKEYSPSTKAYLAGGFVRDKLLGLDSDDIDIAFSNITGKAFYEFCLKYKQNHPDSKIGKSYIIDQNIEKSKHLETVSIEINNLKVDFVNLRSETYGTDSRVPQIEFGNPKSDAERRDLTINSLLYNISDNVIEDYTGGIEDLKNMVLRTPMDPVKTFLDDPLRMLRVFRFYSRYPNSKIDKKTMEALSNPLVQEAYRKKVSPERSGPEILKMLSSSRPSKSIRLLFETGMNNAVFNSPLMTNMNPLNMDQKNKHHKFNLMEHTLRVVENLEKLMKDKNIDKNDRVNMFLSAIFHDYGKAHPEIGKPKEKDPNEYTYIGHEDKSAEIAEDVLKRIGIPENDRKIVSVLIKQHMRPHTDSWSNKSIGRFMKDTVIPGIDKKDLWKLVMIHSQADTMAKSEEGDKQDFDLKEKHIKDMEDYINRPQKIETKPLLDGNDLQSIFKDIPIKPPNKGQDSYIKYVQNKLLDEQLSGNIFTKEEAFKFVESIKEEVYKIYKKEEKIANNWYQRIVYK